MKNDPEKTLPSEIRLTRKELGDLFSVSPETVKRREGDGLLHPEHRNARVLRYTLADVRCLVDNGYQLDLQKAAAHGIRPQDVGYLVSKPVLAFPAGASVPRTDPGDCGAAAPAADFAATVFLAQLKWALRQPEICETIKHLLRDELSAAS